MIETLNLDNRDSTAECLEGLNLVGFIIFMQKDYGVLIRNVYWGGYHAVNLKTADRHVPLQFRTYYTYAHKIENLAKFIEYRAA